MVPAFVLHIQEFISQPWPWYVAGPIIALTMFLLLYFGREFGVSSNLRTIIAIVGAGINSLAGTPIRFQDKDRGIPRYLIGGTILGLGWVLIGACPGPMFILVGSGATYFLIAILGGLLGTFVYGLLRPWLPH